ncbi:MAG: hypothetical protein ACT4NX_03935 [Deltaproteobacteria bacterium]
MKKKELSDLEKARGHFIKAATEGIIAAGFAVKGVGGLLRERQGREQIWDVAGKSIKRGFGLVITLADILNRTATPDAPSSSSDSKSSYRKPRSRKKSTRKIRVE